MFDATFSHLTEQEVFTLNAVLLLHGFTAVRRSIPSSVTIGTQAERRRRVRYSPPSGSFVFKKNVMGVPNTGDGTGAVCTFPFLKGADVPELSRLVSSRKEELMTFARRGTRCSHGVYEISRTRTTLEVGAGSRRRDSRASRRESIVDDLRP